MRPLEPCGVGVRWQERADGCRESLPLSLLREGLQERCQRPEHGLGRFVSFAGELRHEVDFALKATHLDGQQNQQGQLQDRHQTNQPGCHRHRLEAQVGGAGQGFTRNIVPRLPEAGVVLGSRF
jgi:hypothetical protein